MHTCETEWIQGGKEHRKEQRKTMMINSGIVKIIPI